MRALVFDGPGRLHLEDRPDPVPGAGDAVVAIRASGICGSDVHGYLGSTGRRRPGVVMGHEATGVVTAVGDGVVTVRPGDRVALRSILPCAVCDPCRHGRPNVCTQRQGLGMHLDGAYADAVRLPAAMLLPLHDRVAFEDGALIEPLAVAMHAVDITPRSLMDVVVIVGAGTIGLLTLVVARLAGAGRVMVTDRSAHRLAIARQLGADVVIDVGATDAVAAVMERTAGRGADVVFEAVGTGATAEQSVRAARLGGHVTWIGNSDPRVELGMQDVVTRELTLRGAYGFVDEFERAATALAEGRIDVRPLIEHVAPLDDAIELFHALGAGRLEAVKVLLTPAPG